MKPSATDLIQLWDGWDADRSTVKSLVQQVMEYCLPRRATVTRTRVEGEDLHHELFDSTAETACERFATGLYNFMWNPARMNFCLMPPVEAAEGQQDVLKPLLAISEMLRDEMQQSNFDEAFYELALDLGSAGLGTLEVARGDRSLFEFTAYPFEQVNFAENRGGRVQMVLRKFTWTARQIVEEFGPGTAKVGESVAAAWAEDGGRGRDKKFEILHAAIPRSEFTAGERDVLNMPIASVWVAVRDKVILRESGWPQLRYLVCRFAKASGEKHGRGPGMTALPDTKMVNKIERTVIVGAERVVDPPILAPDGSFFGTVKAQSGKLMWYRVNPINPLVKPEPFNTGGRVDFGVDYAESKRAIIKSVFYNDLFLILSDDKRRTATEVRSILAEKLSMLGPSFGRMKVELFDPMIRILLSILGEAPALLRGIPLGELLLSQIRYTSTLAMAMEYAELGMLQDALLFLSPMAELEPSVLDNLSFDEMARGYLQRMAWPAGWLKPRDEVRALREARAQYQAQQMQAAMAMQQAQLAGKLTKRPEPGSVGNAIMGAAA